MAFIRYWWASNTSIGCLFCWAMMSRIKCRFINQANSEQYPYRSNEVHFIRTSIGHSVQSIHRKAAIWLKLQAEYFISHSLSIEMIASSIVVDISYKSTSCPLIALNLCQEWIDFLGQRTEWKCTSLNKRVHDENKRNGYIVRVGCENKQPTPIKCVPAVIIITMNVSRHCTQSTGAFVHLEQIIYVA